MKFCKQRALYVCVVFAFLAVACSNTNGSGTIHTESRPIQGVSKVYLLGDGDIEIEQSGMESLSITADDNLLPLLRSEVVDGELKLGVKDLQNIEPTKRIHYKLTVKGLTGLSLAGDADAKVRKIATDNLKVSITGDGVVHIDGVADSQEVSILGDGKYEAESLTTKNAKVTITGDGKLDIAVSDKLDAKILGDGSINYVGDPVISKNILGDGKIAKRS